MKDTRTHPTTEELSVMSDTALIRYAKAEAQHLMDQKQTAVPRLLDELIYRLKQKKRRQ